MSRPSRIAELATQIAENTTKVDDYIAANGIPSPSFDADGPTDLVMQSPEIEKARLAAIGASMELQDLLQGPVACLRPAINATSLEAIYRYRIPSKVPRDGDISYADLALRCELYEPNLRRILRYAIIYHRVFKEPRVGYVAHSAASLMLVENSAMMDALGMMYDESWQAFARTCDAMEYFKSQEPNETGYSLAHNTDKIVWDYYKEYPARGKRFANSMKSFTSNTGHSLSPLVSGYPWSSLNPGATVVDVGGSEGHVSIALAKANPDLKFVVQDLPEVIQTAAVRKDVESSVAERVQFMAHDFLSEQVVAGDVYLFRWIFHDWPDTYVLKILRNLIRVLKNGAKVVINDQIMPQTGSVPLVTEKQIRFFDLTMLSFFNSREREEEDWKTLFHEADARFQNVKAWKPEGSALGIIEATWMA